MLVTKNAKTIQKLIKAGDVIMFILMLSLLTMAACQKQTIRSRNNEGQNKFFKSGKQAFEIVQKMIRNYHPDENLIAIQKIGYLNTKDTSYAFVVYKSNRGVSNISIVSTMLDEESLEYRSYKCDGEYCDCYVVATIGSGGKINMSCTCSSCYLISH